MTKHLFIYLFVYLQFGQSAMMVASWEGHLGIVEALISAEADANLQDGVIDILYSYNLYSVISVLQTLITAIALYERVCVHLRPEGLKLRSHTNKPRSYTDYTNLEYSTCKKQFRTKTIFNTQVHIMKLHTLFTRFNH